MSSDLETLTPAQAVGLLNGGFQLDLMLKLSKLDIADFGELSRSAEFRDALKTALRVSWSQEDNGGWKPSCGQGMAIKRLEEWANSAVEEDIHDEDLDDDENDFPNDIAVCTRWLKEMLDLMEDVQP
ncbi:hypothetical protein N0V84_002429 [Fusarium piperis]|uniref:Uncharacterized protein n=1 Tax=Fusarium piperis TaxID=1435070 RepID=A0A9W9BSD3_9HYPO|nr:hypothetical protein N0V84_002429 [Fusarium piperis]